MTDKKHPLDETFNVSDEDLVDVDNPFEIPEIVDLNTVVELAMTAYKDINEVIELVEPKNKIKYYELGEKYLNQAKDALYKRDYLINQLKKIQQTGGRKGNVAVADGEKEDVPRKSRAQLMDELKLIQQKK